MPILIPEALTAVAVVALVVALVGLGLALAALRRQSKLRRHYNTLMTGVDGADIAASLESLVVRLASSEGKLSALDGRTEEIDARLRRTVQHVALLRYSAFADSGGDQSFSLALLDDSADGVVLSGLYGRGGMRFYAKPISNGESEYTLTDEEDSVVRKAAP